MLEVVVVEEVVVVLSLGGVLAVALHGDGVEVGLDCGTGFSTGQEAMGDFLSTSKLENPGQGPLRVQPFQPTFQDA